MLKDIIEIIVAALVALVSIIGAVKYWNAEKAAKQYSSELSQMRNELSEAKKEAKEAAEKSVRTVLECKMSHETCQRDMMAHLRDASIHRDVPLEEYRHGVLEKAITDLKNDLSKNIEGTENRLCARLDKMEQSFKTGQVG